MGLFPEQETSREIGEFTNSNLMQATDILLGDQENVICKLITTRFNIPIHTNLGHNIKN